MGKTSSIGIDCNIPNILELPTICIMPESSFLINQNTSNIIKLIFKIKGLPHRMDGQPFLSFFLKNLIYLLIYVCDDYESFALNSFYPFYLHHQSLSFLFV